MNAVQPAAIPQPNLPPELQAAAERAAMQAGVSAGPQMVAPFLTAAGTSMAAKIAANPQLSTQQVLQQVQQSLTALLQQTQVQQVQQSQLPAPSATLPPSPAPAADPDPALLAQMTTLFGQLGFDPSVALDYAKYVTPGYQESRPLATEEIALIDAILKSPNIETLVEVAQQGTQPAGLQPAGLQSAQMLHQPQSSMQPFQEPTLPQWVRLASESSLFVRGVVLVIGGWLLWQVATAHRPATVEQVEQPPPTPLVQPVQSAQPVQMPVQSAVAQPTTGFQYDPSGHARMRAWAECELANQTAGTTQNCVQ